MGFRVLFVCTGNICRSPMAARLLQARLSSAGIVSVLTSSAGTRALTGYGMDASAAAVLRELGVDPLKHVARQLTPDLISESDLILTATTAHRAEVIKQDPLAMRRAFTLREFARLGDGVEPAPPGSHSPEYTKVVAEVAGRRGVVDPPAPGADDIGDPFGAQLEIMRGCGRDVASAVGEVARLLGA